MIETSTSALCNIGYILAGMTVLALIETVIPLHARGPWNRRHSGPNFVFTLLTFAINLLLNAPLVVALTWQQAGPGGLLRLLGLPALPTAAIGIALLDLATYAAHVAMHHVEALWRFHRVHHADPAVDVTTTLRQHPGETLVRYAFLAAAALLFGVGPDPLALYRVLSVGNALFEHANIRLPIALDRLLASVVVSPNMHKVHHSRLEVETNTNYGNILSGFDRLFGTFTPATRGVDIVYGLDGFDTPTMQTSSALLTLPFRDAPSAAPVHAGVPRAA